MDIIEDKQEVINLLRKTKNSLNYANSEINQLSRLLKDSFSINSQIIDGEIVDNIKNKLNLQIKQLDKSISSCYDD